MKNNVFEQLTGARPKFLRKLEQNADLCNVFIALLGRIYIVATNHGLPIDGARMGPISVIGNGEFRSKVTFVKVAITTPINLLASRSSLKEYLAKKHSSLAGILDANPHLAKGFESLVNVIDRWAIHKGINFSDLKIAQGEMAAGAFISREGEIVVRVKKELNLERFKSLN